MVQASPLEPHGQQSMLCLFKSGAGGAAVDSYNVSVGLITLQAIEASLPARDPRMRRAQLDLR